ncbi:MAG: hypothetical protein QN183_13725 [Armatimonadota bacterium]|nr:hypothetical protein [Armatimonadota bacterium]
MKDAWWQVGGCALVAAVAVIAQLRGAPAPPVDYSVWNRVVVSIFYALVVVTLGLDVAAALDADPRTPTLTAALVAEVPRWVVAGWVTWLWLHFVSRLLGRPIL